MRQNVDRNRLLWSFLEGKEKKSLFSTLLFSLEKSRVEKSEDL